VESRIEERYYILSRSLVELRKITVRFDDRVRKPMG